MSDEFAYIYVHGFLNDENCNIGLKLQNQLKPQGIEVEIIDAKGGRGHFDCSVSSGLNAVEECYQKHKKPLRPIGFSMGGLISTVYTSKHPDRVDRLVLLNPALDLESNWQPILSAIIPNTPAEASMQKWKEEGQLMMQGVQMDEPTAVGYSYFLDSTTHAAFPRVDKAVLLLAGTQDILIPLATHHDWKKQQSDPEQVQLIEVDDDHHFSSEQSWKIMIPAIVRYFT